MNKFRLTKFHQFSYDRTTNTEWSRGNVGSVLVWKENKSSTIYSVAIMTPNEADWVWVVGTGANRENRELAALLINAFDSDKPIGDIEVSIEKDSEYGWLYVTRWEQEKHKEKRVYNPEDYKELSTFGEF